MNDRPAYREDISLWSTKEAAETYARNHRAAGEDTLVRHEPDRPADQRWVVYCQPTNAR